MLRSLNGDGPIGLCLRNLVLECGVDLLGQPQLLLGYDNTTLRLVALSPTRRSISERLFDANCPLNWCEVALLLGRSSSDSFGYWTLAITVIRFTVAFHFDVAIGIPRSLSEHLVLALSALFSIVSSFSAPLSGFLVGQLLVIHKLTIIII